MEDARAWIWSARIEPELKGGWESKAPALFLRNEVVLGFTLKVLWRRPMTVRATTRVLFSVAVMVAGIWLSSPGMVRAQDPEDPNSWSALLRYAGEFAGFRVASAVGYQNVLEVSSQSAPSPDIVLFSPGGVQPPPPPCILPNQNTIRCPLINLQSVQIDFGNGNDRLDARQYDSPTFAGLIFSMGQGNDRFLGGPLAENWFGGPGNDFAKAGGGNDRLIGGPGNERMFGGLGIDFFKGGPGSDLARGGPGNDRGFGGPGDDNFRD